MAFLAALTLSLVDWNHDNFIGHTRYGFMVVFFGWSVVAFLPAFAASVLWLAGRGAARRSPRRGLGFAALAIGLGILQAVAVGPGRLLGGYYVWMASLVTLALGCWVRALPAGVRPGWAWAVGVAGWGIVVGSLGYAAYD